jgi:hypothetical protein
MRNVWSYRRLSLMIGAVQRRLRRALCRLSSLRIGCQMGMVIADKSVRLCLVRQVLHRRRVIDLAAFPFEPREAASWPERIGASVKAVVEYFGDQGLPRMPINVSLIGDDIAFRRLYLPLMSRKELSTAILWEGQKLFPFELNQCLVHHEITDVENAGNYVQIAVNLVATKRDIVEALYDRMESASLTLGHVNFLPAVITDAMPFLDPGYDDKHRLYLLLDDDQSQAIFMHRGRLEFFQQFATTPLPLDDGRIANAQAILSELTTFLDIFNGQRFGNSVEGIVLCGRYGGDPDVAAAICGSTSLPCRRIFGDDNIPSVIRAAKLEQTRGMVDAIATGLADIGRRPLIPDVARSKIERRKSAFRLAAVAMLTLLLMGTIHTQSQFISDRLKMQLESTRAESQAYENSAAYQRYLKLMSELHRQQEWQARSHNRQPSHVHLLLKELSRTIPDDISLTNVYLSQENGGLILRLEGIVSLSGFSPEIVLAQYVETLDKSPFFDEVSVKRHLKKKDNGRFDLTFMLEMGAHV